MWTGLRHPNRSILGHTQEPPPKEKTSAQRSTPSPAACPPSLHALCPAPPLAPPPSSHDSGPTRQPTSAPLPRPATPQPVLHPPRLGRRCTGLCGLHRRLRSRTRAVGGEKGWRVVSQRFRVYSGGAVGGVMAASVFCCLRCCRDGGTGHIPLKEMPAVQLDTQHMGKLPPFHSTGPTAHSGATGGSGVVGGGGPEALPPLPVSAVLPPRPTPLPTATQP